ncbi:MAG: hypothetical protein FWC39_07345 [Bacteroidetes bacterium]|nr:hypothetical protein [Bacteroidota bacterium]
MEKETSLRGLIETASKADPKSWLLFFSKYGITPHSATLKTDLRRAYNLYGKDFINDLNRLFASSLKLAAFTGEDLRSITDSIFDILSISSSESKQTPEEKKAAAEAAEKAAREEAEKAEKRKKTIILGFVGLVAIVIAIFVSYSKS